MHRSSVSVALASALATFGGSFAQDMEMRMPDRTLLVAQLNARQVAGRSVSAATGTGVFLLDPHARTFEYRLTYDGLETGGARSITLHNFAPGRDGETIDVLCGSDMHACPPGASATISGSVHQDDRRAFDNRLVGEFDSGRIYVEIVGGNGKAEIRGQLSPDALMVPVMSYVARLAPIAGGTGSGTAVLTEAYFRDKMAVSYAVTVAGASGSPVKASLVGVAAESTRQVRVYNARLALPGLKLLSSKKTGATGGSISGGYEVVTGKGDGPSPRQLLRQGTQEVGIVVTTRAHPEGELYGTFEPVR
jgi:CHRD domain-containing protein